MTKKKKNSGGKKLSAQELQIEILKFLLAHPKKHFSPRQITDQIRVENNKDSAEHALHQLVQAGSVVEFSENKFGFALERLTVHDARDTADGEGKQQNRKTEEQQNRKTEKQQNLKVKENLLLASIKIISRFILLKLILKLKDFQWVKEKINKN